MARSDRYTRKILTSGDRSKWSDLYISDSNKIILGAGGDLQIYHDGTDNHIEATSTLNIGTVNSGVAINIGHTTSEITVNDNLTVTGDLTVNGTTTTINSTTLTVDDKNVVLASGAADSAAADGAGITVDGASATILYEHDDTSWNFNKPTNFIAPVEITSSTVTDFLKLTSGGSSANPVKLIFEKGGSEQGIIEYNRNGDLEIYNTDGDGGVMISGSASADPDFYISHSGASTFKSTVTVGVDDTGHDVKFFGATSGKYMLWDESQDTLIVEGAVGVGTTSPSSYNSRGRNLVVAGTGNVGITIAGEVRTVALYCFLMVRAVLLDIEVQLNMTTLTTQWRLAQQPQKFLV